MTSADASQLVAVDLPFNTVTSYSLLVTAVVVGSAIRWFISSCARRDVEWRRRVIAGLVGMPVVGVLAWAAMIWAWPLAIVLLFCIPLWWV